MATLKVVIAGAGLGGLCLAQSLRGHGVDVEIFERDSGPWDRPQGYRLHLDTDGIGAVWASLEPELFHLFDLTSMRAEPGTTIVDPAMEVQRRVPPDDLIDVFGVPGSLPQHLNVDRATLRQILLTGLDDIVRYGRAVTGYQAEANGGVTVALSDGTHAHGDLLVGADGIRSAVRAQRAPEARTQDTGVRAVYGRVPMAAAREIVPDHVLDDVFTVAVDPSTLFLGLGPVLFPTRPERASALVIPQAALLEQQDYLVCIVGGRKELFPDDATLLGKSSADVQAASLHLLTEWPRATRDVVAAGDPESFFAVQMFTSVPTHLPPSGAVTLLGDAIHAMTPTLGRGANLAMRDAARLGRHLQTVGAGGQDLTVALADYEAQMTSYGFAVVRQSAAMGARLIGQNPLPPATDPVPPLHDGAVRSGKDIES